MHFLYINLKDKYFVGKIYINIESPNLAFLKSKIYKKERSLC